MVKTKTNEMVKRKKSVRKVSEVKVKNVSLAEVKWVQKYHRLVNYIGAAQLYLKDNFCLDRELKFDDIKERILGHWGTVPGLNFLYANANLLVSKYKVEAMFVTGPGHGAPANLANLLIEGTLGEFYDGYSVDVKGMGELIKNFSWPYGFQSHVTPLCPGSILEGGELGYSLSTAFGAVMDNPDLLVFCVIGDGEAESGPLAAAWHANKFLNPKESGAVLPIVHVNGYKISGPTIYSTMSDEELEHLFLGYGYKPYFVSDSNENLYIRMIEVLEECYKDIVEIQRKARNEDCVIKTRWPMIIFRSMKGWTGVKEIDGKKIEGNFRSHGIPIKDPKKVEKDLKLLEEWLSSYKIDELIDKNGKVEKEVLEFVPKGKFRMGMNKHAFGGKVLKELKLPKVEKFAVKDSAGMILASNTAKAADYVAEIFVLNKKEKNFRYFCPDETESNLMGQLFEKGGREYVWPVKEGEEHIVPSGRVIEMLSEHTLQGFLQGYLLTGRHGFFATYEAFGMINASMIDQYVKFLKQASKVPFRAPIASLNYLLTSLGWRQEHNGYSHQNPGLIANALEKHPEFVSCYFPSDANSFMVTMESSFRRKNGVNFWVVGKQNMPQWLSLKQAYEQDERGVMVWDWIDKKAAKDPQVVFVASGDHMLQEVIGAVKILKDELPDFRVRVTYISELNAKGFGRYELVNKTMGKDFEKYFYKEVPIVYNFHGYPHSVHKLLFGHKDASRFKVHGYNEEGGTTTPYDMMVRNGTSRWDLVIDALTRANFKGVGQKLKAAAIVRKYQKLLKEHVQFIKKNGFDMF